MKTLICAKEVEAVKARGEKVLYVDADALITSLARDAAAEADIEIKVGCATAACEAPAPAPAAPAPAAPAPAPAAGDTWECCGRTLTDNFCPVCGAARPTAGGGIDSNVIYEALKALMEKGMLDKIMGACGEDVPYVSEKSSDGLLKFVRSNTAKWLPLLEEGPDVDKVFYNELVSAEDGSSMGAGFITIDHCSFDWVTQCHELYYVVEGTVQITNKNEGKVYTANEGDVIFFEKDADLIFASPNKAKAFYATH